MDIAIDGPAGAGKSTVAKRIAKELSFIYVDTGAMYRAVGLYELRHGVDISDEEAVASTLPEVFVTIRYEEGVQQVILNGENVSALIRTEEVSDAASKTSAYPAVRSRLLSLQRKLALENDVVMDGRDIGTVVLPEAELKIYLSASVEERAKRRYLEYVSKSIDTDLTSVVQEIRERDARDMNRETAPLSFAKDAVYLDTSFLSIDEVVAVIRRLVSEVRK